MPHTPYIPRNRHCVNHGADRPRLIASRDIRSWGCANPVQVAVNAKISGKELCDAVARCPLRPPPQRHRPPHMSTLVHGLLQFREPGAFHRGCSSPDVSARLIQGLWMVGRGGDDWWWNSARGRCALWMGRQLPVLNWVICQWWAEIYDAGISAAAFREFAYRFYIYMRFSVIYVLADRCSAGEFSIVVGLVIGFLCWGL